MMPHPPEEEWESPFLPPDRVRAHTQAPPGLLGFDSDGPFVAVGEADRRGGDDATIDTTEATPVEDILHEEDFTEQDAESQEERDGRTGEAIADEEVEEAESEGTPDELEASEAEEAEEFVQHADFAEDDIPEGPSHAGFEQPGTFSVENELGDFASSLARVPDRVRSALQQGQAHVAVRLMVAAGVRDESRLSNLIFHSRHPELNGRSIRRGERALADEWMAIRNDIVRPMLRSSPSSEPVTSTPAVRQSRRPLSSARVRGAWREDECRSDRMVPVDILDRRTPANARTVEAWAALDGALRRMGYQAERAWVFNCRNIAGTTSRSLHAYGLAVDIDPRWNPNRRTADKRAVRFSTAPTQQERLADVRRGVADTVFTPEQIAAVEAIRTVDEYQVFSWGGRWQTTKDTMHFQIGVTPAELARGIAR